MTEVKVLIEGFLTSDMNGKCRASMCLIKERDIIMISDPTIAENQEEIVNVLKKEGLKTSDVNYVFITHSHLDHYRNIGMFPDAKAIDYFGIWGAGGELKKLPKNLTKNIEIIKTPGHDYSSLSLIVKTSQGVVAICGDVFWKEDYPVKDPYASDAKKLEESRKVLLNKGDYIVPGHGKMFKVKK